MTANSTSENQSAAASTQDVRGSGLSVASGSLSFEIYFSGEMGAGLWPYSDTVNVECKSGDFGGDPGEFAEYMRDCLKGWYDGAGVTLANNKV